MIWFIYFWSMPNKETFRINGLTELLYQTVMETPGLWLDPFANNSLNTFWEKIAADVVTNDLNPNMDTHYHLNALEFLKMYENSGVSGVMFDPPYSLRQLKESYEGVGMALTMEDTQSYFTGIRRELSRVIKPGGVCVSFGWNSIGASGEEFVKEQLALINHGGNHNDTIVLWERKLKTLCIEDFLTVTSDEAH